MTSEEIRRLCELSRRVYQLAGTIDAKDLFPDSLVQTTFDQGIYKVRYVLIEEADRVIVCFRGSILSTEKGFTFQSWRLNFQAARREIPFGIKSKVHEGYLQQASNALGRIKGRTAGKRLIFCGHSQGGALALTLAIQFIRYFRASRIEVVTFGQPRVGNRGICRFLDRHRFFPTERFVNIGDGVSKVPFDFMGYSHCQSPAYLNDAGERVDGASFRFSVIQIDRTHGIENYVDRVNRGLI